MELSRYSTPACLVVGDRRWMNHDTQVHRLLFDSVIKRDPIAALFWRLCSSSRLHCGAGEDHVYGSDIDS